MPAPIPVAILGFSAFDRKALAAYLQKGRPGFAAIDVYESEPVVGAAHPLLKLSNVICTPLLVSSTAGFSGASGARRSLSAFNVPEKAPAMLTLKARTA